MTRSLPFAMMCSAASSNSATRADAPRLRRTGLPQRPNSASNAKFCMLRAPTCMTSAILRDAIHLPGIEHFGDNRDAGAITHFGHDDETFVTQALERVWRRSRFERAAAKQRSASGFDMARTGKQHVKALDRTGSSGDDNLTATDGQRVCYAHGSCVRKGCGLVRWQCSQDVFWGGARHLGSLWLAGKTKKP